MIIVIEHAISLVLYSVMKPAHCPVSLGSDEGKGFTYIQTLRCAYRSKQAYAHTWVELGWLSRHSNTDNAICELGIRSFICSFIRLFKILFKLFICFQYLCDYFI